MSVIRDNIKDVNEFLGDLFKRLTKKREEYLSGELVFEVNVNAFLILNAIFLTSSLPKSIRLKPDIVRQMGAIKEILVRLPKLSIFSDAGRLEKTREVNLSLYRGVVMLQLIRVKPTLVSDLSDVSTRLHTLKIVEAIGSLDEVYDVISDAPGDVAQLCARGCWGALRAASFRGNFVAEMTPLLGAMRRVETLDLSENLIRRVQFLQGCISLTTLDLSNNNISDVTDIAQQLGNVRTLVLRHNRIRATQGLEALLGLEELDLAENAIDDITQIARLAALPILGALWLEGNIIAGRLAYRKEVFALFVKQFSANSAYSLCLDGRYPDDDEYKSIVDSAPLVYNPVISFSSRAIVRENAAGAAGPAVALSSSTVHKRVKRKKRSKIVDLDAVQPSTSASLSCSAAIVVPSQQYTSAAQSSVTPTTSPKKLRKRRTPLQKKKNQDGSAAQSAPKTHRKLHRSISSISSNGRLALTSTAAAVPAVSPSVSCSSACDSAAEEEVMEEEEEGYDDDDYDNEIFVVLPTANKTTMDVTGRFDEDVAFDGCESNGSSSYDSRRVTRRGNTRGQHSSHTESENESSAVNNPDDDKEVAVSVPTYPSAGGSSTLSKSAQWASKIEHIREQAGKRWLIAVNELMKERHGENAENNSNNNNNNNNNSNEDVTKQKKEEKVGEENEECEENNGTVTTHTTTAAGKEETEGLNNNRTGDEHIQEGVNVDVSEPKDVPQHPMATTAKSPIASPQGSLNPFLDGIHSPPPPKAVNDDDDSNNATAATATDADAGNPFLDEPAKDNETNPFFDYQSQQQAPESNANPFLDEPTASTAENSSNPFLDEPEPQQQQQPPQPSASPSIMEPLTGIGETSHFSQPQTPRFQQQQQQQQPPQQPPQQQQGRARKDDAFNDILNTKLRDDGGLEAWLQLKVFQEDVDEFFFFALECTTQKTGCPTVIIIGTKRVYVVAAQTKERVKDPTDWMSRKVAIVTLSLVDIKAVAVGPRYQYLRLEPADPALAPAAALLFLTPVHEKAHIFVDALSQKVRSSYEMMEDYDPEATKVNFEVMHLARQTRANFTSNIIKSKKNKAPPPATVCVYALVQYGEKREPMTLVVTPLRVFVCKEEFYRWPLPKAQFTKERELTITEINSISLDRCSLTFIEDKESWVVFFPNKQELALAVSVIEQLYYAKLRIPLVIEED